MTITAKENIPVMTTAMNSISSSSSSNAHESPLPAVYTKEDISRNNVVEALENTNTETNAQQQAVTEIEEVASKKRQISEVVGSTTGSIIKDSDDAVIDYNGDKHAGESLVTTSLLLETANNSMETTDNDLQEQYQPQVVQVDDEIHLASHGAPSDDTTGATIVTGHVASSEASNVTTTTIDLQRPVKRARTAYFLFLDDYRSTVQKENPGAGVATIAKILGQRWSAMSDDDKQPYHARALVERERVTAATEAWKTAAVAAGQNIHRTAANNDVADRAKCTSDNGVASIVLPVGRVRKICRLDPDVRGISKEALLLITKVTEMVTIQLGQECIKTAHIQNRRTLLPQDIVDVCHVRESFFFLKDDITDLHRQQQKLHKTKPPQNGNASQQRKGHGHDTSTTTTKSLTDYFKPMKCPLNIVFQKLIVICLHYDVIATPPFLRLAAPAHSQQHHIQNAGLIWNHRPVHSMGVYQRYNNAVKFDSLYALRNLPTEILASVLGKFSSGKTISTYVLTAHGDRTLRSTAYMICRNALVERYVALSKEIKVIYERLDLVTEIPDILDIIREDIRLSNDDDDETMCKFSCWCAILDYFEVQLQAANLSCPQWIVWCGHIEIPYGEIDAYIVTPDWSVSALQYWVSQEAAQLSLTHPRYGEFVFIPDDQIPYGTMFGLHTEDRIRLERQCSDLEVHTLCDTSRAARFTLVPLSESYDECTSMIFVDHSYICRSHALNVMTTGPLLIDSRRQSLCCCWDKDSCEDVWGDAISNFGEHVIRIMNSFGNEFTTGLVSYLFEDCREFTNRSR